MGRRYKELNLSKEELEKLYLKDKKTSSEIGTIFGVEHNTILKRLRLFGIPVRSRFEKVSKNILCNQGKRRCYDCKKILPIKEFCKGKRRGFSYLCKQCARRRLNSLKFILNGYSRKHKYRPRKNHKPLKLRFEILKRDKFTCQYCGRKSPDVILEIDHIHPRSKGGKNIMDNFKTACKDCNMGKSNTLLEII